MRTVSVEEMQNDPAELLRRVEAGETLVVVRADQPVAEIRPAEWPRAALRPFGLCAGEFVVPPDFDDPLPGELLADFDGR